MLRPRFPAADGERPRPRRARGGRRNPRLCRHGARRGGAPSSGPTGAGSSVGGCENRRSREPGPAHDHIPCRRRPRLRSARRNQRISVAGYAVRRRGSDFVPENEYVSEASRPRSTRASHDSRLTHVEHIGLSWQAAHREIVYATSEPLLQTEWKLRISSSCLANC